MSQSYTAEVSTVINAPVSKVWQALTDPELIKQYLFGTNTVTDWKVGSPIFFRGVWEGKAYEDKGTVLEFVPNRVLRYNYWSSMSGTADVAENYANVTCAVVAEGEGTKITITQDHCKTAESRDHSAGNWKMILETMKKMLE